MYAFEFKSKIINGVIKVPAEYRDKLGEQVRVILLAEEKEIKNKFIDQLIENPLKIADFSALGRDEIHERK